MADEEETAAPTYSVEYLGAGKTEEPIGWISKAGKANVKYANGDTYCGDYNELKQRHGRGRYTYIRKGNEEDEEAKPTTSVYDGDFRLGKKHGMGTMTYPDGGKYNGSWENDKKSGAGRYEFGKDMSIFNGTWKEGQITSGSWEFQGAGKYDGEFKLGRPFGQGTFSFPSGLKQAGSYDVAKPAEGEEVEEPAEGEPEKPPNVTWNGKSIVSF